jgi:hypothetical protein
MKPLLVFVLPLVNAAVFKAKVKDTVHGRGAVVQSRDHRFFQVGAHPGWSSLFTVLCGLRMVLQREVETGTSEDCMARPLWWADLDLKGCEC